MGYNNNNNNNKPTTQVKVKTAEAAGYLGISPLFRWIRARARVKAKIRLR